MFFNLPTLLTWARIVSIPLVVGVDQPARDGNHSARLAVATVPGPMLGRPLPWQYGPPGTP